MRWFVYLVRCSDGSLYTGITTDPPARVRAHNAGLGATYTRVRGPVSLVHVEAAAGRSAALRREWTIKQWSRADKERLVAAPIRTRARAPRG
jgi:putative endonuclease